MANDIPRKYTDDLYLSKSQLQEELNTSLVDGYWKEIKAYRGAYAKRLGLRTLRKDFNMGIVLTPSIEAKISLAEKDIESLISSLKKMNLEEKEEAGKILFYESLSSINKIESLSLSDAALKQVVSGRYRSLSENDPILNFFDTLKYFATLNETIPPNEDFLGEAYSKLLNRELTSFYRTSDFDSRARLAEQRDQDYPYAPLEKIESAMKDLLSAIKNNEIKPIIRSLLAIYYLDAVAPFPSKNKELAFLLSLDVLASSYGKEAFYLPFMFLLEDDPNKRSVLSGVRTGDFTYFALYAISLIREKLGYLNGEIEKIITSAFREEFNYLSKEENDIFDKGNMEQMTFFDNEEEAKEKKTIQTKPAETKKIAQIKPYPEKKETIRPEKMAKPIQKIEGEISISMDKRSLSDKEIKEYTTYLLESNPSLNKKQASFLASHCTLGHYYTIQQFKKFARCAYETARTSMDKLAEENYYEKKQIKNKYVYTPISLTDKR